jgi:hypothetical protein
MAISYDFTVKMIYDFIVKIIQREFNKICVTREKFLIIFWNRTSVYFNYISRYILQLNWKFS